jgi:hypothetical protein
VHGFGQPRDGDRWLTDRGCSSYLPSPTETAGVVILAICKPARGTHLPCISGENHHPEEMDCISSHLMGKPDA